MSSHEDYARKAGNYDRTREPVGAEGKMPVRRIRRTDSPLAAPTVPAPPALV